jgi:hypothetical protein
MQQKPEQILEAAEINALRKTGKGKGGSCKKAGYWGTV